MEWEGLYRALSAIMSAHRKKQRLTVYHLRPENDRQE
jgi:hypothetical protein